MIYVETGILVAQLIIAIASYYTIYRFRSVYSIKTAVLRMPHGTENDRHALETDHINKLLADGKYTILQILERDADKDLEIVMGQIKK